MGRRLLGLHRFQQANPTDYGVDREEILSVLRSPFIRQSQTRQRFSLMTIVLSRDSCLSRPIFFLSTGAHYLVVFCFFLVESVKKLFKIPSINLCLVSLSIVLCTVTEHQHPPRGREALEGCAFDQKQGYGANSYLFRFSPRARNLRLIQTMPFKHSEVKIYRIMTGSHHLSP
jgi:hypothetical protein